MDFFICLPESIPRVLPFFPFSSLFRLPPSSTLFPYTTLFRSTLRAPCAQRWRLPWPQVSVVLRGRPRRLEDRKSTRLNSSHITISYAVFCLKKKNLGGPGAPTVLLAMQEASAHQLVKAKMFHR